MTQRKRFEAWASASGREYPLDRTEHGSYQSHQVESMWIGWQAACTKDQYPMQPIALDKHGSPRFEANPIIDWLACEVADMNRIAVWCVERGIDCKYREQLAQQVGYSIDGYGTLSYVSDNSYYRAVAAAPKPEDV